MHPSPLPYLATQTVHLPGQKVALTATVAGGATPTGAVTVKYGTTTLGTGTLNSAGSATYTTSSLPEGSDPLTAVYNGDTTHAASISATDTHTVAKSDVSVALSGLLRKSFGG
jgi:hypothetical protein